MLILKIPAKNPAKTRGTIAHHKPIFPCHLMHSRHIGDRTPKTVKHDALSINQGREARKLTHLPDAFMVTPTLVHPQPIYRPRIASIPDAQFRKIGIPQSPFLHLKRVFRRCFAVAVYEVSTILARFESTAPILERIFWQKHMVGCGYIETVGRVKAIKAVFTLPNKLDK